MSGKRKVYTIGGPYVDLDKEVVLDSQGRRIDQAYVDRVVEAAHALLDRGNLERD
jgi:hypothetical protein